MRRASASDAEFIESLAEAAFGEYEPRARAITLAMTRKPGARTWIAMEHSRPLGFAVLQRAGGSGSLSAIAVERAQRGRGVGSLLMRVVQRSARERGLSELTAYTAEANLAALDLLLRHGFALVRRVPSFYSRGQNACELSKRVA